jgi:hypothetical protein
VNNKEREEIELLERKCSECQIRAEITNNPVICSNCYVRDRIGDLEE